MIIMVILVILVTLVKFVKIGSEGNIGYICNIGVIPHQLKEFNGSHHRFIIFHEKKTLKYTN